MSACVHTHLAVWKSTVFPRRNVFTLAGCPQDVASGLNPTRDTLDNPRNRRMTIFFFLLLLFSFYSERSSRGKDDDISRQMGILGVIPTTVVQRFPSIDVPRYPAKWNSKKKFIRVRVAYWNRCSAKHSSNFQI